VSLCIALCNEAGAVVEGVADDKKGLSRLLPEGGWLLLGIDWCGETTFNGLQMKQFLLVGHEPENVLSQRTCSSYVIREQGRLCHAGVHLYSKFVADRVLLTNGC
jgi:hypothetical protein